MFAICRKMNWESMQTLFENFNEEDPMPVMRKLFQEIICDETGAPFEDVHTDDALRQIGILKVRAIMDATMEVLSGGKSSSAAGEDS